MSDTQEVVANTHKKSAVRGLLVLNAVMLMILAAVTFNSAAQGQARSRGEYTIVAGGAQGNDAPIVYIIDVVNQEMIGLAYDANTKVSEGVGYRNLAADAAGLLRPRTRPTP